MNRNSEKSARAMRYYPNEAVSACVLCGSDVGYLYFKGKLVCEECYDLMKSL
jgi:uncharacterized membrane protein